MLEKIKKIINPEKEDINDTKIPRHVGITMHGIEEWVENNNHSFDDAYTKVFQVLKSCIEYQVKLNLRVFTVYVLSEGKKEFKHIDLFLNNLVRAFQELTEFAQENKIKISVFGKWYDLPSYVIEPTRKMIHETKDFDKYYLNLCLNYDGQEEIVDACKMIVRKLQAEKISMEDINKDLLRENLYTSTVIPPDLIIKNGPNKRVSGFLLWDSYHAQIIYTKTNFPDFTESDFKQCIKSWRKR